MKGYKETNWVFYFRNRWIAFGWYPGETFRLFSVIILEMLEGINGKVETIVLFDIQFLRFGISIGFEKSNE